MFFTPEETDVSHFHKVYSSFRLMKLIKINEYCQTKDHCSLRLPFAPFYPFLALYLPFSPSFFFSCPFSSFLSSFPFTFWPLSFFLISFSFLSLATNTSLIAAAFFCKPKLLQGSTLPLLIASSLTYYQLGPDIHRHGILTTWRVPRAWVIIIGLGQEYEHYLNTHTAASAYFKIHFETGLFFYPKQIYIGMCKNASSYYLQTKWRLLRQTSLFWYNLSKPLWNSFIHKLEYNLYIYFLNCHFDML